MGPYIGNLSIAIPGADDSGEAFVIAPEGFAAREANPEGLVGETLIISSQEIKKISSAAVENGVFLIRFTPGDSEGEISADRTFYEILDAIYNGMLVVGGLDSGGYIAAYAGADLTSGNLVFHFLTDNNATSTISMDPDGQIIVSTSDPLTNIKVVDYYYDETDENDAPIIPLLPTPQEAYSHLRDLAVEGNIVVANIQDLNEQSAHSYTLFMISYDNYGVNFTGVYGSRIVNFRVSRTNTNGVFDFYDTQTVKTVEFQKDLDDTITLINGESYETIHRYFVDYDIVLGLLKYEGNDYWTSRFIAYDDGADLITFIGYNDGRGLTKIYVNKYTLPEIKYEESEWVPLPTRTTDNGKFLRVNNDGVAEWQSVPSAEEASF